jgi:hypothetical protein
LRLSESLLAQSRWAEAERIAVEADKEARLNLGGNDPARRFAASNLRQIYEKQASMTLLEQ